MDKLEDLVGTTGTARMVVGTRDTAPRVGSGHIAVLATPVMITLIEEAALAALDPKLPAGKQSLGTHLDISHVAATPTGFTVSATARIEAVEGRSVHFAVRVEDQDELVGEGRHSRVVVTADKFIARIDAKAEGKTA